jgi:hypothetical protein
MNKFCRPGELHRAGDFVLGPRQIHAACPVGLRPPKPLFPRRLQAHRGISINHRLTGF